MLPLLSSHPSADVETAAPGEVLRQRQQQPDDVLHLLHGRVLLCVHDGAQVRQQLGVVEGPFWLDAASAMLGQPCAVDMVAETRVQLRRQPLAQFRSALESLPGAAQTLLHDLAGTSLAEPANNRAYREMTIPAGPEWVEEHIRRLSANGIQTHFQLANIAQLETVERMMRRGSCNVPLILTWVAIGGGFDAPNLYNLANFVRGCPDGSVLTLETSMLNVLPLNMMAIAMGLHVRCGIEDNIWTQKRDRKMGSVEQIEQLVRISREFGRDIATGKEAREIYRIGTFYKDADATLAANGFAPNRRPGQIGFPQYAAA